MAVGAASDNRYDLGYAQFGAFFDGPFHAIEFEDRKCKPHLRRWKGRLFFTKQKFDALVTDGSNCSATEGVAGSDVELLTDFSSQDAGEMKRMIAGYRGTIPVAFVSDPATAGHRKA